MVDRAVHDPKPFAIPEAIAGLFRGEVRVLAASCFENERPLRNLAGWLDWHFQGAITMALSSGRVTGAPGECAWIPLRRAGREFHVVLAGGGKLLGTTSPRPPLPEASTAALRKNLISLGLGTVGVSRMDLGGLSEARLEKDLKGVSLWITS